MRHTEGLLLDFGVSPERPHNKRNQTSKACKKPDPILARLNW